MNAQKWSAIQRQADQLRQNPNNAEKKVTSWLKLAGVAFVEQQPIRLGDYSYILDFAITRKGKIIGAIEVNGYKHDLYRSERDYRLSTDVPYPLLFIDAGECFNNGKRVREKIAAFLDEYQLR